MRPEIKAAWLAAAAHLAMYAWWIWADALLSDDYYLFSTAPNFQLQAKEMFRPLSAALGDSLVTWLQGGPQAVYWAKGMSLALSAAFAGLIAASFARVTGSVVTGVAVAFLVSTNPGIQINSIWLVTILNWPSYTVTAGIFWLLVVSRDWRAVWQWTVIAVSCIAATLLLFAYQIAPFVLTGLIAAYIVLSEDVRSRVVSVTLRAAATCAVSIAIYLVVLWLAVSSGHAPSGRAGGALSNLWSALASAQSEKGLHWFNLFATAKQSAVAVLAFLAVGAAVDVWRSGKERALRWGVAALITIITLYIPAGVNNFQGAGRLYSPGAIGVSGMMVAAAIALMRELSESLRATARYAALTGGVFLGVASQAASVVGVGLTQHAELQYVRSQIAKYDLASLTRVHLIPPPNSAFWNQPIWDPADDMYVVRLSTYHPWTREGIVRFALRYYDPTRRISVSVGPDAPQEGNGVAVVDMRSADRALFQIPY